MEQGNMPGRKLQALKTTRSTLRQDDKFGVAMKALEALSTAYARIVRMLTDEIDRAGSEEASALGGQLRWVSERHKLVKTALKSGPGLVAYVCEGCAEVEELKSLADTAAKLANESATCQTALNLLNYIDQELGWSSQTKTA